MFISLAPNKQNIPTISVNITNKISYFFFVCPVLPLAVCIDNSWHSAFWSIRCLLWLYFSRSKGFSLLSLSTHHLIEFISAAAGAIELLTTTTRANILYIYNLKHEQINIDFTRIQSYRFFFCLFYYDSVCICCIVSTAEARFWHLSICSLCCVWPRLLVVHCRWHIFNGNTIL